MTKATTAENGGPRHSLNWVVSRRARLKIFGDRLECRDWEIPYSAIDDAILYRTKVSLFIPCYVLRVVSGPTVYQFGLNPGRFWSSELPFDVRRETMPMQFSLFSIAVRLVLIAAVVYFVWQKIAA